MLSVRAWSIRGPLIVAGLVSAVLLSSVLLTGRTVDRAREGAARGLGLGFTVAGREHLRRGERLDPVALAEFLDEQRADGLRYVAAVGPGGAVLAQAGDARGTTMVPGFHELGDRVRLVQAIRRRRPRAAARAGPAVMVFEYEPVIANRLRADSRTQLIAAVVASAVVIALALWVSAAARRSVRLEAELERGRRLASLGEMSAVLAHELRNPLASLKGHAQLLAETLPEDDPSHAKAERVVRESVRLERLANDLLDFVRTGELRRAPVEPAALVGDVVAEVGAGRVDVTAAPDLGTWSLDGARLHQALTNVIINAVQVSPDGARVDVTVARDRDRLAITVRDRGPGIAPGDEAAVFEPFHTRRTRGVGLGLAIARRVVEQHGGTITADNHPDGGARFRLVVPGRGGDGAA